MTFSQRLHDLRDAANKMTLQELATRAGLSISAVTKYQYTDQMPTLESAMKIAKALGVSMDTLTAFDLPADPPLTKKTTGKKN